MMDDFRNQAENVTGVMEVSNQGPAVKRGELMDVLIYLAEHKYFILKVAGAAIIAGVMASFLLPVRYTASVRILTPQQVQSSAALLLMNPASGGSSLSALSTMPGGSFTLKNPNDIYVGLLQCRRIGDGVIRQFDLMKVYHSRDMTAARKKLAARTTVTAEKSGLIAVTVVDSDKVRSANLANSYIDQLRILTKDMAVTDASERRLFYEDQLSHAKDALVNAEFQFRQIQAKHGVIQLNAQAESVIGSLAAIQARVDAKQVELEALKSYSTESNPSVQLAETELAALRAQAQQLEEKNGATSSNGLGLQDVAGAGLDYLTAEHEFMYRQALFDLLLKQYDAAKLDEAKEGAIIQVVEPGIPPDRKSFPNRGVVVLIFFFVGLASGCAYAIVARSAEKNPALLLPLKDLGAALKAK
jgi:capsule polysaccharide export protein KpsE/RkpR